MDTLTPQRIEGQGNLEADWAGSSWLSALPSTQAHTLLDGTRRLLVVSPHPDDEVLACGGLMQAALAQDVAVHVVSVTDGEACYSEQPQWPPERLRDARRHELAQAMRVLGLDATHVTPLALPDGGVTTHEADLAAHLSAQLMPNDLVIAPWIKDAHPDHEATGRAARTAASARGARMLQYPVWAWHWLDPAAPLSPWPTAMRIPMDAPFLTRKREAMQAFATQTGDVDGLDCPPILPAHVTARFHRPFEVLIG
ncbi:PIG-L family deacetylase [Stenotrophomonas sp. CFBP8980]|uniref:PIG-L deacetylase family protein n=1 Tax=Stenotrophomonas sp. CFBP8980 TaxID=3096523 RepID=UPI002A69E626|nr:PIG-L family deacetylase [Stenotrophomonas sp. CFBP8980]MDY1034056.1 PIG-L family deacetylase [Stenotrophomonas sp. CFBP8980]